MMRPIVIYGAGGFAREVAALIQDINRAAPTWDFLGYLSDEPAQWNSEVAGRPVLGGADWVGRQSGVAVALGIGSPVVKRKIIRRLEGWRVEFPVLRHPNVVVSSSVDLGPGTILTAGGILTVDLRLGRFVTVNLACTIGHDCRIADYVTIAPGANISGNVEIGEGSDIGTGAAVIQGQSIGEWSVVGAGAVVAKPLPANCTAVGVPAKVIKQREPGWHEA